MDEVMNRDIRPHKSLVDAYPELAALIDNPRLTQAFLAFESRAVVWKRVYTTLGLVALVSVAIATTFIGFRTTLWRFYTIPNLFPIAAAVAGGIGLVAQLGLIFGQIKGRWLMNRYAAERLRNLKFNMYRLLAETNEPADLARHVERATAQAIADLEQELLGGEPTLKQFEPMAAMGSRPTVKARADADFVQNVLEVYTLLRVNVQVTHFTGRIASGERNTRLPEVLSDLVFALAAALSFVEVVLHGWAAVNAASAPEMPPLVEGWLSFVLWSLFVVAAILSVYRHARNTLVDVDRYKQYKREIESIAHNKKVSTIDDFISLFWDIEPICMRELHDFIHDQEHVSYIF